MKDLMKLLGWSLFVFALATALVLMFSGCAAVTEVLQHVQTELCLVHPHYGHVCLKLWGGELTDIQVDGELTPEAWAQLVEWVREELR